MSNKDEIVYSDDHDTKNGVHQEEPSPLPSMTHQQHHAENQSSPQYAPDSSYSKDDASENELEKTAVHLPSLSKVVGKLTSREGWVGNYDWGESERHMSSDRRLPLSNAIC